MTHSEIDTLVRDWPEAARKGYQYYSAVDDVARPTPDADTVYWAMVGRGLAWLADDHNVVMGASAAVGNNVFVRQVGTGDDSWKHGTHPLAAVSAAVLAAKEGER